MSGVYQRKYGVATVTATHIYIPIIKAGANDFAVGADWTPQAGDVKVTKNGGAPANIATLPSHTANLGWVFQFSLAELQCKQLTVRIVDSATKAVEDQYFTIETFGNASAMIPIDFSDVVRMGLTALPNAVAGGAGGLPTDSTGKTSFNDVSSAEVNSACDTALSDYDGPTHAEMTAEHDVLEGEHVAINANVDANETKIDAVQSDVSSIETKVDTVLSDVIISKYPDGYVWFDSASGSTGTTLGTHGTPDNAVNSEADAITLANALGTRKIMVQGTWLSVASLSNYLFKGLSGLNEIFNQSTYDVNECTFIGLDKRFTSGGGSRNKYIRCYSEGNDIRNGFSINCVLPGTVYFSGLASLVNCMAISSSLTFDFTSATSYDVHITGQQGKTINIKNLTSTTHYLHCVGNPDIIIDSGCTSGSLVLSGFVNSITDNSSGTFTLVNQTNIDNLQTDITSIKAVTDVIPDSGSMTSIAQDSTVAKEAQATTNKDSIIAEVDANETKIDTVITDIGNLNDISPSEVQSECEDAIDSKFNFTGSNVDSQVKATDDIGLSTTQKADVNAEVDQALLDYDSSNGVATQSSVDSIQNNTRFGVSIPTYFLIPTSAENVYKLAVNFRDSTGAMEDPDSSDIGLDLDTADGTDKNGILYKEFALTNPLDASGIAGHKKLERTDVGRYFCYVKIASTETENQLVYNFALDESTVRQYYNRSNQMFDAVPGSTTLSDNATNKDIIAEAMKERDVSTTGAVSGSIHKDIMDNIDATETKVDALQGDVTAVKAVTDVIPDSGAMTSIAQDSTVAKEAQATTNKDSIIAEVDANETKIDTVQSDVTDIKTNTDRVDGLIEDSLGDRFTAKALEESPTGTAPTVTEIRQEMDANSTKISGNNSDVSGIKAKTDNLPADPASNTNVDANETKIDALQVDVTAVKTKTDNLPADPASETNATSNTAGINSNVDATEVKVDAVKAKTDNLPADPAGVSDVSAVETKVDTLQTDVSSVKGKTDNLPADPASESNVDATEVKVDAVKAKTDNLPADPAGVSDVSAVETKVDTVLTTGSIGPWTSTAGGDATEAKQDAILAGQVALSGEHSALSGEHAGINSNVDGVETKVDALPSASDVDTELSSNHGAGNWESADVTDIADIKAKTDKLTFDGADNVHSVPKAKDNSVGLGTQEKADVLVEATKVRTAHTMPELVDMSSIPKNPTPDQADMLRFMERRNGGHGEDDLNQIFNDNGDVVFEEDIASTDTTVDAGKLRVPV